MRLFRCAVLLTLGFLPIEAQSPAPTPPDHPIFVKGLVKHAPAGMNNPNDLPHSVQIASLPDAPPDQQALIDQAFAYANQVVAAPAFEIAVQHMDIPGCYQKNYYTPSFRYSNQAVYDLMLLKSPTVLNVIWYDGSHPHGRGSNQGYEVNIYDNTIGANQNAVAQEMGTDRQAAFLASLILHESSHISGFQHPGCFLHRITRSVPYNMNDIYESVAQQLGLPYPRT